RFPKICRTPGAVLVLKTQASTLIGDVGLKSKLGESGTRTKSSTPSKLNAWPTIPAANVAPFTNVPLLLPIISLALPSPGHHPTMPVGGVTQSASRRGRPTVMAQIRAKAAKAASLRVAVLTTG